MIESHATCEAGSLTLTDGLAVLLHRKLDTLAPGQTLEVRSADPSFHHDVRAWARLSGHQLIHFLIDDAGTVWKSGAYASGVANGVGFYVDDGAPGTIKGLGLLSKTPGFDRSLHECKIRFRFVVDLIHVGRNVIIATD